MTEFTGKWKYQSYRPEPASLLTETETPIFQAWSPFNIGEATIDANGKKGKLEFNTEKGLITLTLTIQTEDANPQRLLISAVMNVSESIQFTNQLQGYFVPKILGQKVDKDNPLVVRGSIVQTSKFSPDSQPIYTTGFFVLEPIK